MNRCYMNELKTGETARVLNLDKNAPLYARFMDIGLIKDTQIKQVGKSPLGEMSAYLIRGAVIAIRDCDCKTIPIKINGGFL